MLVKFVYPPLVSQERYLLTATKQQESFLDNSFRICLQGCYTSTLDFYPGSFYCFVERKGKRSISWSYCSGSWKGVGTLRTLV